MVDWKPIPGYEGLYEVSLCGRVRSLDRMVTAYRKGVPHLRKHKGRELWVSDEILPKVILSKNGHTEQHYIHKLQDQVFPV